MQISVDFESQSGLKNQAAFREWARILEALPTAILTTGMAKSLRVGAQYLAQRIKQVVPLSDKIKTGGQQHLRDTVRVAKGRPEYFPSFLVKVGGKAGARHFHLFEYGFRKRGGKGTVPPSYIVNNATVNALPQVDQVVAAETRRREEEIAREARQIAQRGSSIKI